MVRKLAGVIGIFGLAAALVAGPGVVVASAATSAGSSVQRPAARAVVGAAARLSSAPQAGPPLQRFFDYSTTNQGTLCAEIQGTNGSSVNWSNYGCRNVDESFANGATVAVRIYFSPNEGGAWTCLPAGGSWNNLDNSKYTFNSGSGAGAGQKVENNVASSQFATSNNCTKPMGSS
jgi:hypothetical protein